MMMRVYLKACGILFLMAFMVVTSLSTVFTAINTEAINQNLEEIEKSYALVVKNSLDIGVNTNMLDTFLKLTYKLEDKDIKKIRTENLKAKLEALKIFRKPHYDLLKKHKIYQEFKIK